MCYVVLLCRQIMIRVEVVVPYSAGDILSTVGPPLPHSSGPSYIVTPCNCAHGSLPLLPVSVRSMTAAAVTRWSTRPTAPTWWPRYDHSAAASRLRDQDFLHR